MGRLGDFWDATGGKAVSGASAAGGGVVHAAAGLDEIPGKISQANAWVEKRNPLEDPARRLVKDTAKDTAQSAFQSAKTAVTEVPFASPVGTYNFFRKAPGRAEGVKEAVQFANKEPGAAWDIGFEGARAVVKDQLSPENLITTAATMALTGGTASAGVGFKATRAVRAARAAESGVGAIRAAEAAESAIPSIARAAESGFLDKALGTAPTSLKKAMNPISTYGIQPVRNRAGQAILNAGGKPGIGRQALAAGVQGTGGTMPTRLAGMSDEVYAAQQAATRLRAVPKRMGQVQLARTALWAGANPGQAAMSYAKRGLASEQGQQVLNEVQDRAQQEVQEQVQDTFGNDNPQASNSSSTYQQTQEEEEPVAQRSSYTWRGPTNNFTSRGTRRSPESQSTTSRSMGGGGGGGPDSVDLGSLVGRYTDAGGQMAQRGGGGRRGRGGPGGPRNPGGRNRGKGNEYKETGEQDAQGNDLYTKGGGRVPQRNHFWEGPRREAFTGIGLDHDWRKTGALGNTYRGKIPAPSVPGFIARKWGSKQQGGSEMEQPVSSVLSTDPGAASGTGSTPRMTTMGSPRSPERSNSSYRLSNVRPMPQAESIGGSRSWIDTTGRDTTFWGSGGLGQNTRRIGAPLKALNAAPPAMEEEESGQMRWKF